VRHSGVRSEPVLEWIEGPGVVSPHYFIGFEHCTFYGCLEGHRSGRKDEEETEFNPCSSPCDLKCDSAYSSQEELLYCPNIRMDILVLAKESPILP
jgi:hypothetical protein